MIQFFKIRQPRKKKCFHYQCDNSISVDPEDIFRTEFFFVVVFYSGISPTKKRFNQLQTYNDNFGYLFNTGKLKNKLDDEVRKCCQDFKISLTDGEENKDIYAIDLF